MAISVGETVGEYRILEEIGRGGMGRVFKVEHAVTRRVEAMKVLAGGFGASPQAARSLREIQLQASLDHPNIAAVHNAFWAGEDLVLVMELILGRSLRRILEDGRVPLATTLDWAGQALSALSYAHEHGVIHRDISPANMMISSDGRLKLTDFGLAKGPADARLSQTGAPLGSVWYMSPEQVRGSDSDARSDIYSLGAVLYELACGKKPFDGNSAFVIMADQVGKPPIPPMEVDPAVPEGLNAALLRSLEKDPNRRFQTAGQFMACIQDARNVETRPRSRVARSWVVWIAAAILCLAVPFGFHWLHSPADPPAMAQIPSPDPVAKENYVEPEEPATNPPPKPAKQGKIKRSKSGPNIFRKALRPIWPLSKRQKSDTTGH